MIKKIVLLVVLVFLGFAIFFVKHEEKARGFRIGMDPYFYSLPFQGQEKWISAYIGDLVMELAAKEGIDLEIVPANWDTLLEDLGKNYDAVVGSIRPYNFLEEKYFFSPIFLSTDPVLVVPSHASYRSLEKMKGLIVGIEKGSRHSLIVQRYPEIFVKEFSSLAELLSALDQGQIDGALAGQIPAATYLKDLYAGRMEMSEPLSEEEGLRFILLKPEKKELFSLLSNGIKSFKKSKLLQLERKWNLRP